jgi:hypothetical protein
MASSALRSLCSRVASRRHASSSDGAAAITGPMKSSSVMRSKK